MGGSVITRGNMTNSCGGQEASTPETRRGTTRGGGTTRSGQVEAPPDGRQCRDKKLRWWNQRGNRTTSRGRYKA
jgi:hypothetical protein